MIYISEEDQVAIQKKIKKLPKILQNNNLKITLF